jgi:peptidoglycan/xylan/chitin deacetylase (PgdA/CDA1 family)
MVGSLGLTRLARLVHDRGRKPLLCLAYHRVMPIPDAATYPFDLELISATPENFELQMAYVRRHFDPVPLSAVVDHITAGTALPQRPVVVTFDDGYDDNLHYAAPILRRHGITPTIFVATDYVGAHVPYWFELAVYLMMRLPVGSMTLSDLPQPLPTGDDWQCRRRCAEMLQRKMKLLSKAELIELTTRWRSEFAAHIDPAEFCLSQVLDWSDIRRMDGHGFEFGSHSMSHPVLSMLDQPTLREELEGSKQRLEKELKRRVTTLAYPAGKEFAYTPLVQRMARESGYELAAAYVAGVNWIAAGMDTFALRRQNIERAHDETSFQAMLQFPEWVQW